jgi:hypothetical protein
MNPTLVSQQEVKQWVDSVNAPHMLPQLLRKLVHSAVNINVVSLRFPSHEGTRLGGYDGELEIIGTHPYLPEGESVFELSVRKIVKTKADSDYEKRTLDPLGKTLSEVTYVNVNPRSWGARDSWVASKKAENKWKDVRALDLGDIYTWIEQTPDVHRWLTETIKGRSTNVVTGETYFKNWQNKTRPALNPGIVLSGRDRQSEVLIERLRDKSSKAISIKGPSQEESVIFALAVISEANLSLDSTVIVKDEIGLEEMVVSQSPLTLLITYANPNIQYALEQGHKVILTPPDEVPTSNETIVIPKVHAESLAKELEKLGIQLSEAYELGAVANKSFEAFRRMLAENPDSLQPTWLSAQNKTDLTSIFLLGAWTETNEQDKAQVSLVAGDTYEAYESDLQRLALLGDSPILHSRSKWQVASKVDLSNYVFDSVTNTQFEKFLEVAELVLTTPDSKYDVSPDERYIARVMGYEPVYSSELYQGVAETMALVASKFGEKIIQGSRYEIGDLTDRTVSNILEKANADTSGKIWLTLNPYLSLLAEASPQVFIDRVENNLNSDSPTLKNYFISDQSFFADSPYTSLMFALQRLSWNPDYFASIVLIDARLNNFAEGVKSSPNPMSVLHESFNLLHPLSTLTNEQKLDALDLLAEAEPEIAFDVLLGMIPENHNTFFGITKPHYRNWGDAPDRTVTYDELYKMVGEVVERLIPLTTNVDRLISISKRITDLAPAEFDKVIQLIDGLGESFGEADKNRVWETLREIISNHRRLNRCRRTRGGRLRYG